MAYDCVVYGQVMLIHTHCWCGLTGDMRVGLSTGCSATAYHQPPRKGSCWLRLHKRLVRSMTVTTVNHNSESHMHNRPQSCRACEWRHCGMLARRCCWMA